MESEEGDRQNKAYSEYDEEEDDEEEVKDKDEAFRQMKDLIIKK